MRENKMTKFELILTCHIFNQSTKSNFEFLPVTYFGGFKKSKIRKQNLTCTFTNINIIFLSISFKFF